MQTVQAPGSVNCPPQVQAKRLVCKKTDVRGAPRRVMTGRSDVMMSLLQCYFATQIAALLGAFFVGLIAVQSPDLNNLINGVTLTPLENAFGYVAVIYAVIVTFGQFGAAHLAPHITIVAWLSDKKRFTLYGIIRYLSIFLFELLGFFLAALWINFVLGGASAVGGCGEPVVGTGFVAQFFTALFVKLLVGHIFLLSASRHNMGGFGALAIALAVGAAILSLRGVSGGSYSLWRYLGVGFVQGGGCLTAGTAGIEAGTAVAAGLLNYLLCTFLFTRSCSNLGKEEYKRVYCGKCRQRIDAAKSKAC